MLGATSEKNMLQAALSKKLCLEQRHQKKCCVASDKNMLQAALGKKLLMERNQLKNPGCCLTEKYA